MPKTKPTPPHRDSSEAAVNLDRIGEFQRAFESDPAHRQAMNAICNTPLGKVAQSRRARVAADMTFSCHLPENKVTSQGGSGRCWLFAALNTLRPAALKSMNVAEEFEFSQNYPMFWDKLEKANYFLESILATLDEPVGSRILDWLLGSPIQDGGQWDMFVNIVTKYGAVPKKVMPETESSSSTGAMNGMITAKLRENACRLRQAHAGGADLPKLREEKLRMLSEVYRMLCIHLGEPPTEFDLQWRDKDKEFHRVGRITPKEFYATYVGRKLEPMVCLIHCPQPSKRMDTLYTVRFLGNVVDGGIVRYLNVDLDTMKSAAIAQLKSGEPVWFGCDVGKFLDRDLGMMDTRMFDYDLLYGTSPAMTKAERLDYCHSSMNHAMVFTGVDLDDADKPLTWRVENSWGDRGGESGFYAMTDEWFDEYNYEVVVRRKYVPRRLLPILKTDPIVLEPWDPMGALAMAR